MRQKLPHLHTCSRVSQNSALMRCDLHSQPALGVENDSLASLRRLCSPGCQFNGGDSLSLHQNDACGSTRDSISLGPELQKFPHRGGSLLNRPVELGPQDPSSSMSLVSKKAIHSGSLVKGSEGTDVEPDDHTCAFCI